MATLFWDDERIGKEEYRTPEHTDALEKFTSKTFGKIHELFLFSEGIRILLSEKGFSVWFSREIWTTFDVEVGDYLVKTTHSKNECWLARGDYCFIKIDIDPEKLQSNSPLFSRDPKEYLKYSKEFVTRNFIDNPQCYPGSILFTIGYLMEHPNVPSPFRLRLGGQFRLTF